MRLEPRLEEWLKKVPPDVVFKRVPVAAGESEMVTVPIDPLYLKVFSAEKNAWEMLGGEYTIEVGGSSALLPLKEEVSLAAR